MSTVWHQAGDGWQALTLGTALEGAELQAPGVRVFRYGQSTDKGVGLLARPGARVLVNGQPVLGGFRVLEHKDEILVGRTRLFFSSEATPAVVGFRPAVGARPSTCPVCRGLIKEGEEIVQCPGCSRRFHQVEPAEGRKARKCWTFADKCKICNHPTSLSGEPVWRPEKEEGHG